MTTQWIDDDWPSYWDAVSGELGRTDQYREDEHRLVVEWFARHWDLSEPLTDDPGFGDIRFQVFDAIALRYRFQVIAIDLGGIIRLSDFALVR